MLEGTRTQQLYGGLEPTLSYEVLESGLKCSQNLFFSASILVHTCNK